MTDQQSLRQTLNQILTELDGFSSSEGLIVIAATNFPEVLDKALTRPGRFDRHVEVRERRAMRRRRRCTVRHCSGGIRHEHCSSTALALLNPRPNTAAVLGP